MKIVANPKKKKNPKTSVTVVTNTADANAGSTFTFFNITGTIKPAIVATTIFKIIAVPITIPNIKFLSHR